MVLTCITHHRHHLTIIIVGGVKTAIVLNTEFEFPQHDTLLNLDSWVHHIPHLLPQGRTVWIDPKLAQRNEDEAEADDQDEDKEKEAEEAVEPEAGPELLTMLTEDSELPGGTTPWSVQLASKLSPVRFAPVALKSNRWPGAVTVGYNEKFANIYVGWGLKEIGRRFVPAPLPAIQTEYGLVKPVPEEAGLQEQNEVSLEDEKAYLDANKPAAAEEGNANEDGEGDGEDQEEEEDQ